MTFQEYLDWHKWEALMGLYIGGPVFLLILLGLALQRPQCKSCGRTMQRRWKKPSPYSSRWFCPFHDDGSPWP